MINFFFKKVFIKFGSNKKIASSLQCKIFNNMRFIATHIELKQSSFPCGKLGVAGTLYNY